MPQTSTTPPRRSQAERVAESERRLLGAAAELIAEQGYERTTTADICKRAGMSNSMVHMRYGSKEALLEALLSSYEEAMLGAGPDPNATGLEALMGQVDAVREQHRENPQFMRAFFMIVFETVGAVPQMKPWLIKWLDRYITHIAKLIRGGQKDGTIRADVDPRREANFFMDAGTGPLYRWALNPDRVDLDAELKGWSNRMREWFAA
jgi:AcrR family transcriptional regulator